MLRLRYLSWLAICAVLLSTIAPVLPARAASLAAIPVPLQQDDIAERIAEIRSSEPDLSEDFSRADALFDTGYDGSTVAYFKSGELRIAVDEENTLAWSTLNQEVNDFYAEVDAIHRDGSLDNQFGFLARLDADTNYYLFAASSDGYYTIQLYLDGEWEALVEWTETDQIVTGEGERNTLGLLAEGDTFTFLINDSIVDEITDDTLDGTIVALNAAAFSEPGIDVGFDNFRLWYIGEQIEVTPRRAPVDARNVTVTPEPSGTPTATAEPTAEQTTEPTTEPTAEPTAEVTPEPTEDVTVEPTSEPTPEPTAATGTSSNPMIAAIQGQPPTFSDDFEDGDVSDWLHFPSESVGYETFEGAFEFVFNTANVLTWSELPVDATRYYLETDATIAEPITSAEYGIIFNYVDSQNLYLYAINNASRYSIWRLVSNNWEEVSEWTDTDVLLSGDGNTNRLGLLVDGATVVLIANDEVLAEIEMSETLDGGVALAAGTFEEPNLIMSFDNVALWDLDALGPLPTVEPTAESTGEPTTEPTDEPISSAEFDIISARIEEIVATEPFISDDFRRDSGTWDTQSHDFGGYFYESRQFHIEASAEERIIWSAYYEDQVVTEPVQFTDFYVEFDTSFIVRTGENAAGLVFRLGDTDNFYKFVVDEIGYYQFQKRVNGEYSDIITWELTTIADDSEGSTNRIGIWVEDSTFAFTINGEMVAIAEDDDLDSGAIALAIQTYTTAEGHSTFDNLDLWVLNE